MAAGYGWDWGPDLAGVGIWQSVGIESWSGVRLASVRPLALVEGTNGRLETHVELEWADAPGERGRGRRHAGRPQPSPPRPRPGRQRSCSS